MPLEYLVSVVNVAVEHVVADLEHLVGEEKIREGDLVASRRELIITESSELNKIWLFLLKKTRFGRIDKKGRGQRKGDERSG